MEQRKQAMQMLTCRISGAGYQWIRAKAAEEGVPVSLMVRRMLGYASINMPKGYKLPRENRT